MTDKEIIRHGVDVSKCEFRNNTYFSPCGGCENDDNCYYKQLQRKTAECEKKSWEIGNLGYKIKNQRREINERLKQIEKLKEKEQECKRYKQAIEEIEKEIKGLGSFIQIKDIIDKVKDSNDE